MSDKLNILKRNRAASRTSEILGEGERVGDVIHQVARIIEDLGIKCSAEMWVGDVYRDRILERVHDSRVGHRIAWLSASKLAKILRQKPVYVETTYEGDTSKKDPLSDPSSPPSYTPN